MTKFFIYFIFLFTTFVFSAKSDPTQKMAEANKTTVKNKKISSKDKKEIMNSSEKKPVSNKNEIALLAGGCFWGVEELIRNQPGVVSTQVGYTGGVIPNPTYEIVKKGTSGHAESIQVEFDPQKTSYESILKFFFKIHDPTTKNQQGNDVGSQYRSAIFFFTPEQEKIAKKVKELVDVSGAWKKPVVTEILAAGPFYSAETYHQDYLQKNPSGYTCHYIRDIKF